MYILKISGVTVSVVLVVVFVLRGCGLSREYSAHDHPLLAQPRPWALLDLASPSEQPLPWGDSSTVPVWTVVPDNFEVFAGQFEEFTREYSRAIALSLPQNAPEFSGQLIRLIDQLQVGERMVFLSPHDGLIRDLRKELPEALFNLGMADSTQFYLLHTFFLESLAQFSADLLVVTPEFLNSRKEISPRILREIRRRNKSTLFDLRKGGDQSEFWQTPADGYILPVTHKHLETLRQLRLKEGGQEGR